MGEVLFRIREAANGALSARYNKRFEEGQRVAVYIQDTRLTGEVLKEPGRLPGQIKVFIDGNDGALSVYPFECRKLKPKGYNPFIEKDGKFLVKAEKESKNGD